MAKKRVHLTESQSYRLIQRTINEEYKGGLDWKTLVYSGGYPFSISGDIRSVPS